MRNPWKPIYRLSALLISKITKTLESPFDFMTNLRNLSLILRSWCSRDLEYRYNFIDNMVHEFPKFCKLFRNEEIRRLRSYLWHEVTKERKNEGFLTDFYSISKVYPIYCTLPDRISVQITIGHCAVTHLLQNKLSILSNGKLSLSLSETCLPYIFPRSRSTNMTKSRNFRLLLSAISSHLVHLFLPFFY